MALTYHLHTFVTSCEPHICAITTERKQQLALLVDFIAKRHVEDSPVRLNFICTHNSRRSQLGQLWAITAAHVYGIKNVSTFSGGTEATAFNPRAVAAIERAGFRVASPGGDNPAYQVTYIDDYPPVTCFSKCFNDPINPVADFAAVMTCTDADQNCPAILGATRISLPYCDPKESDDTAFETACYDERCLQIASEMLWVFRTVSTKS